MLSTLGVSLVFTGHFHAQDITRRTFDNGRRTLYDIETGSTVTAPCPYRRVAITADQKAWSSKAASSPPLRPIPRGFAPYADDYVYRGTIKLADTALRKYGGRRVGPEQNQSAGLPRLRHPSCGGMKPNGSSSTKPGRDCGPNSFCSCRKICSTAGPPTCRRPTTN